MLARDSRKAPTFLLANLVTYSSTKPDTPNTASGGTTARSK